MQSSMQSSMLSHSPHRPHSHLAIAVKGHSPSTDFDNSSVHPPSPSVASTLRQRNEQLSRQPSISLPSLSISLAPAKLLPAQLLREFPRATVGGAAKPGQEQHHWWSAVAGTAASTRSIATTTLLALSPPHLSCRCPASECGAACRI